MQRDGADQRVVGREGRCLHRGDLLELLRRHGPQSRSSLAKATGLTNATISNITGELIEAGILEESHYLMEERRGRRAIALRILPGGGCVVGVALNMYENFVVLGDMTGKIIARRSVHDALSLHPSEFAARVADAVRDMSTEFQMEPGRIFGVGVSAFALFNPRQRILASRVNRWERVQLADLLEAELKLPVRIGGLAESLNVVESYCGVSSQLQNVLLVNVGIGMGASYRIHGKPLTGIIGELGRSYVPDGTNAGQGARLDELASGWGLLRRLEMVAGRPHPNEYPAARDRLNQLLLETTHESHPYWAPLKEAGAMLGRALCAITPVLTPEAIVMAGPLGTHDAYVQGVREMLIAHCVPLYAHVPALLVSSLDGQSAAVHMALDEYVYRSLDLPTGGRLPYKLVNQMSANQAASASRAPGPLGEGQGLTLADQMERLLSS